MKKLTPQEVYKRMITSIDELETASQKFNWEDPQHYAEWLAQSYMYVRWTTRQLALASAMTKPSTEDSLHWRFIEEANEEKKHELLVLNDLKNLGYSIEQFQELPHTSFFYQTLSYLIMHEHPSAILGYSLTLEGFAAQKSEAIYQRVTKKYSDKMTTFLRVHVEVDKDHFANALPHLESCPEHLLPLVLQGIEQCAAIYKGILTDIEQKIRSQKNIKHANPLIGLQL